MASSEVSLATNDHLLIDEVRVLQDNLANVAQVLPMLPSATSLQQEQVTKPSSKMAYRLKEVSTPPWTTASSQ